MNDSSDVPTQLEGQLLLADPSLRDGFFNKSVILLTEHSEESGAYGIILNHPTGQTVGDLITSEKFYPLRNVPVYLGGPVGQEHLSFASFWIDDSATEKSEPALKFATRISAKDAVTRTQQPGTLIHAFAGHSSWTAGQLEGEIRKNAWIPTLPSVDLLATEHEKQLWAKTMRSLSPYHQILAEAPDDLYAN